MQLGTLTHATPGRKVCVLATQRATSWTLCRAAPRAQQAAAPRPQRQQELASLALTSLLLSPAGPALAEDLGLEGGVSAPNPFDGAFNFSGGELALVTAPIVLYGAFSLYRAKVNPRLKFSDFAFIVGAAVVLGNIVSILVFKKRIF